MDKDLTLMGAGASKVKIDGQKEGYPVLHVGPSEVEVTVKDLTLQGPEVYWGSCKDKENGICPVGLAAFGYAEFRVNGVANLGNKFGIALYDSSQATVESSKITDNNVGIVLQDSAQTTVQNNSIRKNNTGIKIYEPENFNGTLKGSCNVVDENKTDFIEVSESTRKELSDCSK